MGTRVESVYENQSDYMQAHRLNCNSFHFLIGDNEDLTGLSAKVKLGEKEFEVESPTTVMIPENHLHSYRLSDGGGWFFHVLARPSFQEAIPIGEREPIQQDIGEVSDVSHEFLKRSERPTERDRPIGEGARELRNPQRYVLVKPDIFQNPGIYAALHSISPDMPFELNQQLHSNYEDEAYMFFAREGERLQVDMYSTERDKVRVTSPATVYHPKGSLHRYEHTQGRGFMLVILKERTPGEGYAYIPLKKQ